MIQFQRFAIRLAVFLGGAMLMAMEVAAFRMIGKTFGSALRETTAVIAVFLASMSIGYWAGGLAGDRWPRLGTMIAALLAAGASLLYVPGLDALVSPKIAASALGLSTHAFLATAILFAVPTFLFSTISPIAVRLMATTTDQSGKTAGSISAVSTAGSIIGSILTAFLLIDWLASIARTVILISVTACATAALLILASIGVSEKLFSRRVANALGFAALLVVTPTALFIRSTRLEHSLLQGSQHVLFVGDSAFHRVLVREPRRGIRELLFNATVQSRMDVTDPFGPANTYTDSLRLAQLMRPAIKRILIIGLGGGTAAKQFCHDDPKVEVDAVEVDPMVVDVARRFFSVTPGERLRIHIRDGRMFLKQSGERWDLIIIDAYTTNRYGDTIPPHLATREFFDDAAAHLTPGGILHFHCAFSGLLPALQKTIASTFASVLVSRGEILASSVPLLTSKDVLIQRSNGATSEIPMLGAYIAALAPIPRIDPQVPLLTDDYAPVDTLIRASR